MVRVRTGADRKTVKKSAKHTQEQGKKTGKMVRLGTHGEGETGVGTGGQ